MITVHTLVRNEEKFVWYALQSVLPFVEKIFVWDTGSTDKTVEIIRTIKSPKLEFEEKGRVDARALIKLRQEMIKKTQTDWIMILDGDEIWWDNQISNIKNQILKKRNKYNLVVNPCYMAIGDIFHYQEEAAGMYKIHNKTGHLNIRFIRNFPGLKVSGVYPDEAFQDKSGKKLQNFSQEKILFSDEKYLHLSHLIRSNQSRHKYKYELGISFPKDFYYPEVLFRDRPKIIPSPWETVSSNYKLSAGVQTPLKKVKRRIL